MSSFRIARRRLARQPGFALLAVGTLSIGFAATAAILAVVDAVLVRPLPYPAPDRLVAIEHAAPGLGLSRLDISELLYLHYAEHSESFAGIGLVDEGPASVGGLDRPLQVRGAAVTPSVFRLLEAVPLEGRTFTEDEGAPGGRSVAVVSEGFRDRVLGADPDVLGRRLVVDGRESEIVGVLGEGFTFPAAEVEIWTPYVVDPGTADLGSFGQRAIARLRPDVEPSTAGADLSRFVEDLTATFPAARAGPTLARAGFAVRVEPLRRVLIRDLAPVLWLLLATAAFLLLLATVNVANLFVARAEARQKETAIRAALGAAPGDVVRLAMAEGWWIAVPAAILGLGVGRVVLPSLLEIAPGSLPTLRTISVDLRVAAAAGVLAAGIGAALGLVALVRSRGRDLAGRLKDGGRSVSVGRASQRLRKVLVTVQVAVAAVLLLGAGLMIRTLQEVAKVEPGFVTDGGLSFRLTLPAARATTDVRVIAFYERVLEGLAALPGIEGAASATTLPLAGRASATGYRLEDRMARGENELPFVFETSRVSPDYFGTMGIPLVRGRLLDAADFANRRRVVLVSRALADAYWPGEEAVGRRLFPGRPDGEDDWFEVVGVVGDVQTRSLTDEDRPAVYFPWAGPEGMEWDLASQAVVVRGSGDARELVEVVREAVWDVDPEMPLADVRSLEELVRGARSRASFTALLLSVAASVALLLAAIGTYGVLAYLVARRRVEFGVRMALGAEPGDVLGLVLREGLVLAGLGVSVGWVVAAGGSRILDSLLYHVEPLDPTVFVGAPAVLLLVALVAGALPALRASRVSPVDALHDR